MMVTGIWYFSARLNASTVEAKQSSTSAGAMIARG